MEVSRLSALLVLFAAAACALNLGSDKCTWGPGYWCSHISHAKQCESVNYCMNSVWKKANLSKTENVCKFCDFLVKGVLKLKNNYILQEKMRSYLVSVCSLITDDSKQAKCQADVKKYLPDILTILKNESDAGPICFSLNLCLKSSVPVEKENGNGVGRKMQAYSGGGGDDCTDCKAFFGDLVKKLTSKKTVDELQYYFSQGCHFLGPLGKTCQEFVHNLVLVILKNIASCLDPNFVCSALHFCSSTTSNNLLEAKQIRENTIQELDIDVCHDCIKLVKDVKGFLNKTSTVEEVKNLLDNSVCSYFGRYAGICKLAVDSYAEVLLKMMLADVDPKEICQVIRACPSKFILKLKEYVQQAIRSHQNIQKSSSVCNTCEIFLGVIHSDLADKNFQNGIKDGLILFVCPLFSSFKNECVSLADSVPESLEILAGLLDSKVVCGKLNLCTGTEQGAALVKPNLTPRVNEDMMCKMCKIFIKELDKFMSQKPFQQDVIIILDKICDLLPTSWRKTCENFVAIYVTDLIQLLLLELQPEFCTTLNICHAHQVESKLTKDFPDCTTCENVLVEVKRSISELSEAEFKRSMYTYCDKLTFAEKIKCKKVVDKYGRTVYEDLLHGVSVKAICQLVGYCQKNSLKDRAGWKEIRPAMNLKISTTCDICKLVVKEVRNLLSQNYTKTEIKNALEKICSILPASLKNQCDSFVKTYEPAIIDVLISELDADAVCKKLGICGSKLLNEEMNIKQFPGLCPMCRELMQLLDACLSAESTVTYLESLLKKICGILPGNIATECIKMVNLYTPAVLKILADVLDPKQICQDVKICSSALHFKSFATSGCRNGVC